LPSIEHGHRAARRRRPPRIPWSTRSFRRGSALDEADAFFMSKGKLHDAAARIGRILDELEIPYAIA
jgi:hypothetical protein